MSFSSVLAQFCRLVFGPAESILKWREQNERSYVGLTYELPRHASCTGELALAC
jgi:hypothetical protein